jgi:hypothetical protein
LFPLLLHLLLASLAVCCAQGTLREALDAGLLLRGAAGGRFVAPGLAVGLAQDIAAAMVHLHGEGAATELSWLIWGFGQLYIAQRCSAAMCNSHVEQSMACGSQPA